MLPGVNKTKEQLSAELAALRLRIAELEQIEAGHKQADEELPRYGDYLDGLVGGRTAELKALNWHLQQQINERKQAEEESQQQNEFLNNILDSLTHPFYVLDANDYKVKMANRAAELGSLSESQTCYSLAHRRDKPCGGAEHVCPLEEVKKTKKPVVVEHIHYDGDGNARNIEVHGYPIFDTEGNVVQMIEYFLDITERKQAEEELQESHDYLGRLTNSMGDAVFSVKMPERVIEWVNDGFKVFGYDADECIGRTTEFLYPYKSEFLDFGNKLKKAMAVGKQILYAEQLFIRKNGEVFPAEVTVTFHKEKGEVVGVTSIVRDITERKQAEEREKELQEELNLASRLAAVGELAAGVAHEMNNPLTGILGFSERLSRKSADDDTKESLELIHHEAQRLAKVVKNLLTFARRREPKKEYADINDILQKTLDLRAYELKTGNIEVSLELAANLPQIMVDFHQIQEVFVNIILNAEQVMTEASGGGKLTIKTRQIKDYVRISFSDDGPGIPAQDLGKVFNPFFTTKGERGGTGLGLSVCHGIVTEHGGRIYARSKPGGGATFLVDLPLTSSETGESQIVKEQLAL